MPKSTNQHHRRDTMVSLALAAFPAVILGIVGISYLGYEAVIAEKELKRSADQFAEGISKRLLDTYESYLDRKEVKLRMVLPDSIQQFIVPTAARSNVDEEGYQLYQSLLKTETLHESLSAFQESKTPAGLPLLPIAQLQVARYSFKENNRTFACTMLKELLKSVVMTHPSMISSPIMSKVEEISKEENVRKEIDWEDWKSVFRAKTATRQLLFRNQEPLARSDPRFPWFEDGDERYFRKLMPTGEVIPLSKTELEDLAGAALSEALVEGTLFPNPLALRLQFEGEALIPAPLNDTKVRQQWLSEHGFDMIAPDQKGKELASVGSGTPFTVWVAAADSDRFESAVRKRIIQQGSFLSMVMACLGFGIWRTWKTMEAQRSLNERQSNLISSISHELRSPVAGIRLMAERLSQKNSETEYREKYSKLIEKESNRLGVLIENILDAGSITDGQKVYQFEWTNLSALVEDTVERIEPLAEYDDKKIELRTGQPDISAEVDPVAMQQALGNLIDNALKFSDREKVVTVSLDSDTNTDSISLSVSDEGIGITGEDLPKIFELFFRAGSELQRETTGTGLGLHLVQHIVESHHGTITVKSAVGKGSTFTINFPRKQIEGNS